MFRCQNLPSVEDLKIKITHLSFLQDGGIHLAKGARGSPRLMDDDGLHFEFCGASLRIDRGSPT